MKILAALYDSYTQAQAVVQELIDAGFSRDMISIVANNADNRTGYSTTGTEPMSPSGAAGGFADNRPENYAEADAVTGSQGAGFGAVVGTLVALGALLIPGVGPIVAAGPLAVALGAGLGAAAGAVTGGITASLVKTGISDEDAAFYEEGIRSGGTLVTIEVADDDADDARRIMDRNGATNIDERGDYTSSANYSTTSSTDVDVDNAAVVPADAQFATTTSTTTSTTNTNTNVGNTSARTINAGEEARLQVVEEDIAVGKRAVERGGVRVYQTVSERPVEEQVRLREERVVVERHPVNQSVDPSAINNFQEGVIEVTERGEEAVVQKTARVVEEVVVGKEATERTETVRDTVRRTDVQVEQIPVGSAYSAYETNFRSDYDTNYASSGVAFDPDYNNAYRYGYDLANNQQYAGYDWDRLESTVRSDWESRYPNSTWDRFSGAVRSAWNQATGRY